MKAWSHLPNAALIDEVLASLETSPEKWNAARGVTQIAVQDAARAAVRTAARAAVRSAARAAAWDAAWGAAKDAVRNAARAAAWDAAWGATRNTAWDAARGAVRGAIAALIAYDDAGQFMKLPVDHLRRLHRLDPHPMFLLLQPAVIVLAEQGDPICPG